MTAIRADRLSFRAKLDTLCADLSRGQQQKVMITAALPHEPEAVFTDEPLANLDPIVQETVKEFFESYRAAGNALFPSTHHIGVAASICTRVAIVADGRVQRERRPTELSEESLLDEFRFDAVLLAAFALAVAAVPVPLLVAGFVVPPSVTVLAGSTVASILVGVVGVLLARRAETRWTRIYRAGAF